MRSLLVSALISGTLLVPAAVSDAAVPDDVVPDAVGAPLNWQPCTGVALECATVKVPLDYRHPHGTEIDIAVSRSKSPNPAARRGVLLLNPGGPGGSGLTLPDVLGQVAPRNLRDAYDLIGFDPRGTGRSTPNSCALSEQQLDGTKLLPYPEPNGDIRPNVAYARQVAKQCFDNAGDRLPYVTTANTARDMDRIREALGERKISYFGVSYGSYLGAVYTTMFPAQSDRIVLDSVVDPRGIWRGVWQNWGASTEETFEDFATWAAERHATYGLGGTPAAVRATYLALAANLDTQPIKELTGNSLRAITRGALYNPSNYPLLAEIWQAALRGEAKPLPSGAPDQQAVATLWGIVCGDAPWPRSVPLHQIQVSRDKHQYPITNGMPSNVWPCAFWPAKPIEPPVRITDRGPSNVLLTQNLRDPATPLVGARAMRAAMGDRAKLVTADQSGHGTYLITQNPCVTAIGTDFLVNGKLPAQDVRCGPTPQALADASGPHAELVKDLRRRQFPF